MSSIKRLTKLRPQRCGDEEEPLNGLSAHDRNYTATTLNHLISSLCAIVLYLICASTSLQWA